MKDNGPSNNCGVVAGSIVGMGGLAGAIALVILNDATQVLDAVFRVGYSSFNPLCPGKILINPDYIDAACLPC
ncbi:hypothetical protein AB4Y36_36420 [Paraburkholderia sp. BR10936]|uniref:hypothetical protein n=1 Tax=Paraburkholderia sp. BR10936 TaxID=3236993 RepID=UPI0034D2C5B9